MILVLILSNIEDRVKCRGWRPLGPISIHWRSSFVACLPSTRLSLGRER